VRRADNLYHLHVPIVMKSGSLKLLELSGPVQVCNRIDLPCFLTVTSRISHIEFQIRRHIPTLPTNPSRCMELSLEPAYINEKLRAGANIHMYMSHISNNPGAQRRYQAALWKRAKRHCSVKNRLTQSVVDASPPPCSSTHNPETLLFIKTEVLNS